MNAPNDQKSLRDEFAMAALKGILAHEEMGNLPPDQIANLAYDQADAMLKARKE